MRADIGIEATFVPRRRPDPLALSADAAIRDSGAVGSMPASANGPDAGSERRATRPVPVALVFRCRVGPAHP